MLDYNKLPPDSFFENAIVDGKITPKMIIDYISSDTYWFMKGITKTEHKAFITKIKSENTAFLKEEH